MTGIWKFSLTNCISIFTRWLTGIWTFLPSSFLIFKINLVLSLYSTGLFWLFGNVFKILKHNFLNYKCWILKINVLSLLDLLTFKILAASNEIRSQLHHLTLIFKCLCGKFRLGWLCSFNLLSNLVKIFLLIAINALF